MAAMLSFEEEDRPIQHQGGVETDLSYWKSCLAEAVGCDGFGQSRDASEQYERLAEAMLSTAKQNGESLETLEEYTRRIVEVLLARRQILLGTTPRGPSLQNMRDLSADFLSILTGLKPCSVERSILEVEELEEQMEIILTSAGLEMLDEVDGDVKEESEDEDDDSDEGRAASEKPRAVEAAMAYGESKQGKEQPDSPAKVGADEELGSEESATLSERRLYPMLLRRPPKKDQSFLTLTIQRIGVKDYERYIEPFVSVVVCDKLGNVLERQDTPVATIREPAADLPKGGYLVFNQKIFINYPLEHIFEGNGAFFLEFKHYKPDKNKISCRCWSLIECDEVLDGPAAFELYKKPSDYRRRSSKIQLFSVKRLYLHAHLDIDVDPPTVEARNHI